MSDERPTRERPTSERPESADARTANAPMLICFGGLPGAGKTSVARLAAPRLRALHLRIDSIEQAIRASWLRLDDVGNAGYCAAYAVAEDNLRLGCSVLADAVNPVAAARAGWREVAERSGARLLEVELVCSDRAAHRERVERRRADIVGLRLPVWAEVAARAYEPWDGAGLRLDTAALSAEQAAARVVACAEAPSRPTR